MRHKESMLTLRYLDRRDAMALNIWEIAQDLLSHHLQKGANAAFSLLCSIIMEVLLRDHLEQEKPRRPKT